MIAVNLVHRAQTRALSLTRALDGVVPLLARLRSVFSRATEAWSGRLP